nr:hypothetical protein [uncultured Deefgea sp.]
MRIKTSALLCASVFLSAAMTANATVKVEFWSHALGGTYDNRINLSAACFFNLHPA